MKLALGIRWLYICPVTTHSTSMPIKRDLDHSFFREWNDNMAYVLGFFAADGNMLQNNRGAHYIEFQITDKQILMEIKKAVKSNHKITSRLRGENCKTSYRLQLGSKEWFVDLERLGLSPRKSLTLKLPPIPDLHKGSFVRGYFDGDGGVYFKKYKSKDRTNKRWVFTSRFTSGSKDFLLSLHNLLKTDASIKGGSIVAKANQRGFDLVFSHHDSVALYWFMYNNAPRIYLKRKYSMFHKALTTLYGETMRE